MTVEYDVATLPTGAPETKVAHDRASHGEVAAAFAEFSRAFAAFREANDARIDALETRMAGDPVIEDKVARIDRAVDETKGRLDRLMLEARRPALAGIEGRAADPVVEEHRSAFAGYMRGGETAGLKALELKAGGARALSAGSGPDGGYLTPAAVERDVLARLGDISPMRALASVRLISGAAYKGAVTKTAAGAGWVAETGARAQTDTPVLAELDFPALELYALPAATQTLLDDAVVNIEEWLVSEVETAFAEQEGRAFIEGSGTGQPKGVVKYPTAAHADWEWGKLGTTVTGASGAFPASNPADILLDLIYSLKAGYRQNGVFLMNRKVQSAVRKLKGGDGHYLWQPPATADQAASLFSFPIVEAEHMPDIGADSLSIAFGDFRRGYLVVDRAGVRVLRDPYSAKPYVLFYTTKRVGGGVQDFDAIKLLKFGTSAAPAAGG
ncbi:HK97 family phage major capsid protein [Pseudochelatococcus lubricantis]|uniref:HK97 family phage major capsid protein n=1 Tax=Pseudochelatococcus lubricantis TaxID=1538102 RepID=A0ABX0V3W4_9HYPH|nr:phage major capsid protein [Pseudochelatococcus lubricantis]NIJ57756.1 HK97 family phage major capsid protein [Pseudochelatococcus lubricantis]